MIILSQKKMDDFEAYKIYIAMKSHFQGEYDFVKYKGGISATKNSFHKRKDKKTFEELSRRFNSKDFKEFLLSTFLDVTESGNLALARNEFMWTGRLLDDETLDIYTKWKKRIQSLSYIFKNDCEKILLTASENDLKFDEIFKSIGGDYPLIMRMEKHGEIALETLIVFQKMFGFLQRVKINDSTYFPAYKTKCLNYADFLDINIDYYKDILKKVMVEDFYEEYGHQLT